MIPGDRSLCLARIGMIRTAHTIICCRNVQFALNSMRMVPISIFFTESLGRNGQCFYRSMVLVSGAAFDRAKEIMYHLTVSAKLAEKYDMYKPATDGAGKENEQID